MSRANLFWLAAYLAVLGAVVWGMLYVYARRQAIATFDNPQAKREWQEDRDELRERSTSGPVRRKVTERDEPPALILMRDYFWRLVALSLLLASALFFVFMIALRGAFGRPKPERSHEGNGHV
jgi:hypothetical protein